MLGSLIFLTPRGGLAVLALGLPLAGLALAARRERSARQILRLEAPPPVQRLPRVAALVAVPVLLGLAATQPALRSRTVARVRTDAQAFFVVDVSRSMMASRTPSGPTRLERAKQDAIAIREAISQVPSGIATLTDRVLPDLFPNPDPNVFAQTMTSAVAIENPPPNTSNVLATSLGALGAVGTQNFFDPTARRRVAVVLTDAETSAFNPAKVAHDLEAGPGVKIVLVHVWSADERVFDANGQAEQGYHVHPESTQAIASVASAAGGQVFGEGSIGKAAQAVRADLGNGPTRIQGRTERTRTLAPYVALLALLPLLSIVRRSVRRGLGSALRDLAADKLRQAARWRRFLRPAGRPASPAESR
jgi:hypothetical protein